MEWKIGEIKQVNGEWYQCVKQPEDFIGNICKICAFQGTENCDIDECSDSFRSDKQGVIFKKLEKVGEPIIYMSRTFQRLKSSDAEQCKYCYFGNQVCNPQLCGKESFLVEVKQNKEDMGQEIEYSGNESDNAKHSNSESIGKNLKPFDLEAAKAGMPVCTRDGRKAIFLITLSNKNFPFAAIVSCGQEENIYQYDINGICDEHDENLDLMMLPEKKEGWVNVYRDNFGLNCSIIYDNKDIALSRIDINEEDTVYIDTVKISWEE